MVCACIFTGLSLSVGWGRGCVCVSLCVVVHLCVSVCTCMHLDCSMDAKALLTGSLPVHVMNINA